MHNQHDLFPPAARYDASEATLTLYITFSPGQSKLGGAAQLNLLLQATAPYTSRIITIAIDGYANDVPDPAQADKLAAQRAQAVHHWLIVHRIPSCEVQAVHQDVPQSIGGSDGGVIVTIRYARSTPPTRIVNPASMCGQSAHHPT
jgi:hypothetical protein